MNFYPSPGVTPYEPPPYMKIPPKPKGQFMKTTLVWFSGMLFGFGLICLVFWSYHVTCSVTLPFDGVIACVPDPPFQPVSEDF